MTTRSRQRCPPARRPHRLERAAALRSHGFTVEILVAAAAHTRVKDLIPQGAGDFTGASETLRLSGIDADINTSERYQAVKARVLAMGRLARRRRDPAAAGQPGRRRGQRPRGHRNRRATPRRRALPPTGKRPRPGAYGQPSAVNRLLILNAEPRPGRGIVLLLRQAIRC